MTFDHTVGIMFFFNISPSMLISCSVQRFGVGGIYHSAKTIEVNDRKTSVCVCVCRAGYSGWRLSSVLRLFPKVIER